MITVQHGTWDPVAKRLNLQGAMNINRIPLLVDIDFTFYRMAMWIRAYGQLTGYQFGVGDTLHTEMGTITYQGASNMILTLFDPEDYKVFEKDPMIHVAVARKASTKYVSTEDFEAYYVTDTFDDIHEDHIQAARMLDAAANEDGHAYVKGLGSRTHAGIDVHYVIEADYVSTP